MKKTDPTLIEQAGDWKGALPNIQQLITQACEAVADHLQFSRCYTLAVVLADDPFIQQLNAQFRGKDAPTNVLSFPADDEEGTELGDIILSLDTLAREAQAEQKELAAHCTHLVVHGVLHLLGYDHMLDDEAEEMEALEVAILAQLGIASPYESDYV